MSGMPIFSNFAKSDSVRPGKTARATRFSRRLGLGTHVSTFKVTKERRKPIKCGKWCWPCKSWRILKMQTDHYTYRVTWSAEDNEHVGLCVEFPSLSWLAKTPEESLKGIRKTVAGIVKDMRAAGEDIPSPLAEKHYSGEFRVRIPPEVHRALATQAAEQGVSLNRLASAKLAATSSM